MFNENQVIGEFLAYQRAKSQKSSSIIFGKIIREIRKKPIVQQEYTSDEIRSSVEHIINVSRTLRGNKRRQYITNSVQRLNKEFRSNLGTWNFIFTIDNFKLQPRSFNVGPVKFFKFTSNKRKEMRSKVWKILRNNPHYNFQWKKNYIKDHDKRIYEPMVGKTCALVQVKGRLDKAQLIANDKIETAIAILKLYKSILYDHHRKYFHITGKVVQRIMRTTLRYTTDGKNLNPVMEWVGSFFPFELDNKKIQSMKKAGFSKINKIFKNTTPDNLEKRILNSIRLFGSACNIIVTKSETRSPIGLGFPSNRSSSPRTYFESIAINERLLSLFVALESLLIFGENEPLSNNIAERAAFLLADKYPDRLWIKKFMRLMYSFRSVHVHHGKSKLDHGLLEKFTYRVQIIILKVVFLKDRMNWTSENDLKNWFEMKKLT